jgi:mycothiol synthase
VTVAAYPIAPAIPGITFRHLDAPDDFAAMNDIANAMRIADGEEWVTSYEQFRTFYEHLSNCDPRTDIVIAERDGRMVGYGRAAWYEEIDGLRIYEPIAFAGPDEGVPLLDAITGAMEERCRQIAAGHPPGRKLLQLDAVDGSVLRESVLRTRGYEPVRYGFQMVRPTLDDLPDAPLPEGLEIRPVQPDQLRQIFDAEVEAFRDHWGASIPTDADFEQFVTDPVQANHALWRVAWDGDEVAGMVRGFINAKENERFGRKRGYVENISVRRPWRRRGLARALIAATITGLREAGMTEGALGVDTENPSGALRLYESCGFVVTRREAVYRKPLD